MSPEQARGEDADGRSDLFSLGIVLYELLTGERPFQGDTVSALLYQIVHVEPKEMRIQSERLPEQFDALIRKALDKNPAARFGSGREMAAAIKDQLLFQASPAQTMMVRPGEMPVAAAPPSAPTPIPAASLDESPGATKILTPAAAQSPGPHKTLGQRNAHSAPAPSRKEGMTVTPMETPSQMTLFPSAGRTPVLRRRMGL